MRHAAASKQQAAEAKKAAAHKKGKGKSPSSSPKKGKGKKHSTKKSKGKKKQSQQAEEHEFTPFAGADLVVPTEKKDSPIIITRPISTGDFFTFDLFFTEGLEGVSGRGSVQRQNYPMRRAERFVDISANFRAVVSEALSSWYLGVREKLGRIAAKKGALEGVQQQKAGHPPSGGGVRFVEKPTVRGIPRRVTAVAPAPPGVPPTEAGVVVAGEDGDVGGKAVAGMGGPDHVAAEEPGPPGKKAGGAHRPPKGGKVGAKDGKDGGAARGTDTSHGEKKPKTEDGVAGTEQDDAEEFLALPAGFLASKNADEPNPEDEDAPSPSSTSWFSSLFGLGDEEPPVEEKSEETSGNVAVGGGGETSKDKKAAKKKGKKGKEGNEKPGGPGSEDSDDSPERSDKKGKKETKDHVDEKGKSSSDKKAKGKDKEGGKKKGKDGGVLGKDGGKTESKPAPKDTLIPWPNIGNSVVADWTLLSCVKSMEWSSLVKLHTQENSKPTLSLAALDIEIAPRRKEKETRPLGLAGSLYAGMVGVVVATDGPPPPPSEEEEEDRSSSSSRGRGETGANRQAPSYLRGAEDGVADAELVAEPLPDPTGVPRIEQNLMAPIDPRGFSHRLSKQTDGAKYKKPFDVASHEGLDEKYTPFLRMNRALGHTELVVPVDKEDPRRKGKPLDSRGKKGKAIYVLDPIPGEGKVKGSLKKPSEMGEKRGEQKGGAAAKGGSAAVKGAAAAKGGAGEIGTPTPDPEKGTEKSKSAAPQQHYGEYPSEEDSSFSERVSVYLDSESWVSDGSETTITMSESVESRSARTPGEIALEGSHSAAPPSGRKTSASKINSASSPLAGLAADGSAKSPANAKKGSSKSPRKKSSSPRKRSALRVRSELQTVIMYALEEQISAPDTLQVVRRVFLLWAETAFQIRVVKRKAFDHWWERHEGGPRKIRFFGRRNSVLVTFPPSSGRRIDVPQQPRGCCGTRTSCCGRRSRPSVGISPDFLPPFSFPTLLLSPPPTPHYCPALRPVPRASGMTPPSANASIRGVAVRET